MHVIPCIEERMAEVPHLSALAKYGHLYHASIYGSIFPAIWSLMLALRARGIGSSLTTVHLMYEREAAALLGVPDHVMQVALLPIAYFKGTDFKPAKRLPAHQLTSWNGWGQNR